MKSDRFVVLACGDKKRKTEQPAYALYDGSYFRACLGFALSIAESERIFILSAKHGLITLRQPLKPYQLKMGQPGSVTVQQIGEQALRYGITDPICLGGKLYMDICRQIWPNAICPISGHRWFGPQMKWLKQNRGRLDWLSAYTQGTGNGLQQ